MAEARTWEISKSLICLFAVMALSISLFQLAACATTEAGNNAVPSSESESSAADEAEEATTPSAEGEPSALVFSTPVILPFDKIVEGSSLVVYGTVTDKKEELVIQPSNGGSKKCYTDYYFEIEDTFRGEADQKTIAIRCFDGKRQRAEMGEEHHGLIDPILSPGDKYILFLYRPSVGNGELAKGDYYMVVGGSQGEFYESGEGRFVIDGNDTDAESFKKEMAAINKEIPVDEEYDKNHGISSLKGNLERGIISQEIYDQSIKVMDTWAEVVE